MDPQEADMSRQRTSGTTIATPRVGNIAHLDFEETDMSREGRGPLRGVMNYHPQTEPSFVHYPHSLLSKSLLLQKDLCFSFGLCKQMIELRYMLFRCALV